MPLVRACAPVPEVDLLAAYGEYCDRLGLTGVNLRPAARTFLRRWPDPQRSRSHSRRGWRCRKSLGRS